MVLDNVLEERLADLREDVREYFQANSNLKEMAHYRMIGPMKPEFWRAYVKHKKNLSVLCGRDADKYDQEMYNKSIRCLNDIMGV